ncbi:hypothetical protein ABZW10_31385 [Kitasatospora sp. NPDC004723]|uniref:hypothetical protein n=1 Tax=Kitasatospora sp. NPDC004723 TaxID=3154288 RepID=UPI0033B8D61E
MSYADAPPRVVRPAVRLDWEHAPQEDHVVESYKRIYGLSGAVLASRLLGAPGIHQAWGDSLLASAAWHDAPTVPRDIDAGEPADRRDPLGPDLLDGNGFGHAALIRARIATTRVATALSSEIV